MGSVVGLVYLAMRHGVRQDGREQVSFEEDGGGVRLATIPRWHFDAAAVKEMA